MSSTPPARRTPPPQQPQTNANPPPRRTSVVFGKIAEAKGHRVGLYGTGGVGKSTLACLMPGPVAFVDADESLPVLKKELIKNQIPLPTPVVVNDWDSLISALDGDGWDKIKTIVVDTASRVEEWAVAKTLSVQPKEGGGKANGIEDYGYGKGYQYVFETFRKLLMALDRHVRAGRHVVLICHECVCNVPNPAGEDWIRYEPRLQSTNGGKASIRLLVKEWVDHLVFLGYDVSVNKDSKAKGGGVRLLHTAERPQWMAKSRTTDASFSIEVGASPWEEIVS